MLLMRTAARIELLQERAGAFRISLGITSPAASRAWSGVNTETDPSVILLLPTG
jgi:hypothetical protein